MTLDVARVRGWSAEIDASYCERDSILYALALGFGQDPTNPRTLRFVYERELVALPTLAITLGDPGFWMQEPAFGIDWRQAVLAELRLEVSAFLPAAADLRARNRLAALVDRGEGRGAQVFVERTLIGEAGETIATFMYGALCRADGGCMSGAKGDAPPPRLPDPPDRPPDEVIEIETRPEMALLYRWSCDLNPLHADPDTARGAGFPRPILHGHATIGLALRALLSGPLSYDVSGVRAIGGRFTAPFYPGEGLAVSVWHKGSRLAFTASATERAIQVVGNGVVEIRS